MAIQTFLPSNIWNTDEILLREVIQAAERIVLKLNRLNLENSGMSAYNQRYIGSTYTKLARWGINVQMLAFLLSNNSAPREKLTLFDYGAGAGSICLLAKSLGIGMVVYSDIYDTSCKDAAILAKLLELEAEHYICGELETGIDYLDSNKIVCDLLVSHNCLEHIYDIEGFLNNLVRIPTSTLHFWLSTGANPLRHRTKKALSKVAVEAEHNNREKKWGHKERDSLQSYFSIREKIILDESPRLNDDQVKMLAKKTRGMRDQDIRRVVCQYAESGVVPGDPKHPTNTCDPHTGNWAERLMNPYELANIMRIQGMQVDVKPTYWSYEVNNRLKNGGKVLMNYFISKSSIVGLRLSPNYVLYGSYAPA